MMDSSHYLILIMCKYSRTLDSICEGHYNNQTMAFCTTFYSVMNTPLQKTRISHLQEIILFQSFIYNTGVTGQNAIIYLEITLCKMFIN